MVVPALIYVALATIRGPADLVRGWAIPCATDIAFSAMIARVIFPAAHPAIPFLLLLAIADDALGLIILVVFYPSGPLSFTKLGALMMAAVLLALWLRQRRTHSFWPYVLGPGALSWAALYLGYASLQQSGLTNTRLFFQDLGADGLSRPGTDNLDVMYERGVQTLLNGNPQNGGGSKGAYQKKLREADAQYSRLLQLAIDALRPSGQAH